MEYIDIMLDVFVLEVKLKRNYKKIIVNYYIFNFIFKCILIVREKRCNYCYKVIMLWVEYNGRKFSIFFFYRDNICFKYCRCL